MAQVRARRGASRRPVIVVAAVVIVAVAVACVAVFVLPGRGGMVVERGAATTMAASTGEQEASAKTSAARTGELQAIVVHVDGAVASPGVYELSGDNVRVRDAVEAAGGLVEGADTSSVNLAAPVADGQKVHVPTQGEQVMAGSSVGQDGVAGEGASQGTRSSGLVNINLASAEELDALPGVGPSTAAAIVEEREQGGPFSSPEDLMRVSGIGEKKFAKLRDHICV